MFKNETPTLPLVSYLIHSATITEDDFERREYANYLEATTSLPKYERQQIEELGAILHQLHHPFWRHQN